MVSWCHQFVSSSFPHSPALYFSLSLSLSLSLIFSLMVLNLKGMWWTPLPWLLPWRWWRAGETRGVSTWITYWGVLKQRHCEWAVQWSTILHNDILNCNHCAIMCLTIICNDLPHYTMVPWHLYAPHLRWWGDLILHLSLLPSFRSLYLSLPFSLYQRLLFSLISIPFPFLLIRSHPSSALPS